MTRIPAGKKCVKLQITPLYQLLGSTKNNEKMEICEVVAITGIKITVLHGMPEPRGTNPIIKLGPLRFSYRCNQTTPSSPLMSRKRSKNKNKNKNKKE